jgi:predicted transcriptional regulator
MENQRLKNLILKYLEKFPAATVDEIYEKFQKLKMAAEEKPTKEIIGKLILDLDLDGELPIVDTSMLKPKKATKREEKEKIRTIAKTNELDETDKEILKCFYDEESKQNIARKQEKIAELIDIHPKTLNRHLSKLVDLNLVFFNPSLNLYTTIIEEHLAENQRKTELQNSDIPDPPQISELQNSDPNKIIVICPRCQQRYSYKPKTTRRMHKYCKNCKKNFEIKKIQQNQIQSDPLDHATQVSLELQQTDKEILKAFFDVETQDYVDRSQKQIADILKKHKSTISRRLKHLVELGIISVVKNILGNFASLLLYRINRVIPAVKADLEHKLKNYVTQHNVKVEIPIISGIINANFYKKSKMNNWSYKYFTENDLDFQLSPQNVFFWPTGIGETREDALDNIREKTQNIHSYLEKHYQVDLGQPRYYLDNIEQHYVPIRGTNEEFDELKDAWTDKSHKGAIETSSKRFVDNLINMEDAVLKLEKENLTLIHEVRELKTTSFIDVKALENNFAHQIQSALTNFKNEITKDLIPAMTTAFFNALKQSAGDQSNIMVPDGNPNNYI